MSDLHGNAELRSDSTPASGFADFGLHPALERAVRDTGFTEPTPIQTQAVPSVRDGRDVLGLAQTGTGKTAAFGLPILHRLLTREARGPRVLVLAPTRELASQIQEEFRSLARHTRIQVVSIFGGVSMNGQVAALRRNPEVIVACPGRLLDHCRQGTLRLGNIEMLVLDEADQMFDMGFLPDIRRILDMLPAQRQNLLFSATMPPDLRKLANQVLRNPVVVEAAAQAPAETVDQAFFQVDSARKTALLQTLVAAPEVRSAIIFTRTKHRARKIADQLARRGHRAVALQGNMSQAQRDRAMQGFRKGQFDILVATDIAARGIDVAAVSHVINFDVPMTPEAYTHRIGRTGRARREGEAWTLVTSEDTRQVRAIENLLGSKVERRALPDMKAELARQQQAGPTESLDHRPPRPAQPARRPRPEGQRERSGGPGGPGGGPRRRRRRPGSGNRPQGPNA